MYSVPARIQRRRRRRLFLIGASIVLLAAACGILYRLPVSLLDINRVIQLAAGKFSHRPAEGKTPENRLRGTIYDRRMRELAVSYRLFSLYVHPAKVTEQSDIVDKLAQILGTDKDTLEKKIRQPKRVVELADDLDADQAQAVKQLNQEGVYCQSSEERFYPEHTAAAQVLGYTSEGLGLSGMEGKYDILLHAGEYKAAELPDIDFRGNTVLGRDGTDLILTIDIELQKKIDGQLQKFLRGHESAEGMAVLLNPANGNILALSSQPTFNPNYFWQAKESVRQGNLYIPRFDPDLIRPLLIRAAAAMNNSENFAPLLPQTIAAVDYGLSEDNFEKIIKDIRFLEPVLRDYPAEPVQPAAIPPGAEQGMVSVMQIGIGLASLINGGWRKGPIFCDSVYDLKSGQRFTPKKESVVSEHVLTPAMSVVVRRELLSNPDAKSEGKTLTFTERSVRVVPVDNLTSSVQQQLFVGMIPREKPEFLLVMAIEHNTLAPSPQEKDNTPFPEVGEKLLANLYTGWEESAVAEHPPGKNEDNMAQFLISRRVEYIPSQANICYNPKEMPKVTGMSLRKGLQQLNHHNLKITIQGSGRIVSQSPAAGVQLDDSQKCVLVLESRI